MVKVKVADWDTTASNNTEINGIDIDEGCAPSGMNNAARETMAQVAKQFLDDQFYVGNASDPTKKLDLDLSAITTGTTRTWSIPDRNGEVSSVPRGHIYGLTTSNNASDSSNDIDIAAGECASDATTPVLLVLASSITKRLDASWAVGTNQGGLDTGSKANSTWYYIWAIGRSDTGVVDVLFSASATSPTMPTNYDRKRRIPGAIRTDGSGNILAFTQNGREFTWTNSVSDFNSNISTTASLATLTVPPLSSIVARFHARGQNATGGYAALITSTFEADQTPSSTNTNLSSQTADVSAGDFAKQVNSSGQIRLRSTAASTAVTISTYGWIDNA